MLSLLFSLLLAGGGGVYYDAPGGSGGGGSCTCATTLTFSPDNTYDIGATGARPKDVIAAGVGTFSGGSVLGAATYLTWTGRSKLASSADGYITATDNAGTAFTGIRLGGATSSFPMLKRSTTALEAKLADDSAYTAMNFSHVDMGNKGSDAAPTKSIGFYAENAYSDATSNRTGAPIFMHAGATSTYFTIVKNSLGVCTLSFYYLTRAGVSGKIDLVSGTDFALGADDTAPELAVTANNLVAAINAHATLGTLVVAAANAAKVHLTQTSLLVTLYPLSSTSARISNYPNNSNQDAPIYMPRMIVMGLQHEAGGRIIGPAAAGDFFYFQTGDGTATGLYATSLYTSAGGTAIVNATQSLATANTINWSSTTAYSGTKDTGIKRGSAGVIAITNGSSGAGKVQGQNASVLDFATDGKVLFTNNAATEPAYVLSSTLVSPKASTPVAIAVLESGTLYTNEGATGQIVFTLPSAAANYTYTFYVQDSDGIRVTANTGDTIRVAATVTAAAGYLDNSTLGGSLTITAINSTEWVATAHEGTWVAGP